MSEPIELIVFDCDGVLVDTERIAVRALLTMGPELGWPLTEAEILTRFIGRNAQAMTDEVSARLGPAAAAPWHARFRALHAEYVDAGLTVVDGIHETLAAISLPTCVASSGSHDKMRHTLGRTGLYDHFAGRIFSADDPEVARGKPAPDLFLHAAARMGVRPGACVVVEDSRPGVRAARAAGMRSFGYAGGVTPAQWLAGPDTVVFQDMRDLPELLSRAVGA
ncbi:HAD family hydrolase [Streptomyces sp. NBC_01262]|uniref:HAD family hydrolase n=1 Tax=Streptomyces sp. NBC_01262 TaxID=2903803 RepID=UPI002E323038|nr:HAD family hydrolase [Streptomyces sp. NBC_01262]